MSSCRLGGERSILLSYKDIITQTSLNDLVIYVKKGTLQEGRPSEDDLPPYRNRWDKWYYQSESDLH